MSAQTQVSPELEPTPEFDAQCRAFVNQWQHGDIPPNDTIQALKSLADEAKQSGHTANIGRAEHISGYIQHYLGNLTTSIRHYDKARSLFQRVGNRRRVATMDLNQGENYRFRGEFKRARQLYRNAYNAATDIDNLQIQAMAIANEGLVLVSMKEYDKAYNALQEGYRLSRLWEQEGNPVAGLLTEIDYGLAIVALEQNQLADAWTHALNSLEQARASESIHSMGLAYRILGDTLTALSDVPEHAEYDNPDDYYRTALDYFAEIDAEAEIGRTKFSHGKSLAARDRRMSAAKFFRDAMVIFSRLRMTDDAAKAAEAQLSVL